MDLTTPKQAGFLEYMLCLKSHSPIYSNRIVDVSNIFLELNAHDLMNGHLYVSHLHSSTQFHSFTCALFGQLW